MPKYQKKPVTIEAEQFDPDRRPWPAGVTAAYSSARKYIITTREGPMWVKSGDWIITGVKGERCPCKPDIFAETYEKVDDDA